MKKGEALPRSEDAFFGRKTGRRNLMLTRASNHSPAPIVWTMILDPHCPRITRCIPTANLARAMTTEIAPSRVIGNLNLTHICTLVQPRSRERPARFGALKKPSFSGVHQ